MSPPKYKPPEKAKRIKNNFGPSFYMIPARAVSVASSYVDQNSSETPAESVPVRYVNQNSSETPAEAVPVNRYGGKRRKTIRKKRMTKRRKTIRRRRIE
jgi:hypothetical protein